MKREKKKAKKLRKEQERKAKQSLEGETAGSETC